MKLFSPERQYRGKNKNNIPLKFQNPPILSQVSLRLEKPGCLSFGQLSPLSRMLDGIGIVVLPGGRVSAWRSHVSGQVLHATMMPAWTQATGVWT
jgi:hypothetical protein